MNLTQVLHRAVELEPDRPLTVCEGRVRTAAESAYRVARLAGALRALGVASGDRVAVLSRNSDTYHEILLAVPWAGAVINPVNVRFSAAEAAYSLTDCDARLLLVEEPFLRLVPELRERVPKLGTIVVCGRGPAPEAMLRMEDLIAEHGQLQDQRREGADLYGIFYTGGTTGAPKGVMLSHANLLSSALASMASVDVATRGGRLLHVAPMFHMAAIWSWLLGMLSQSTHFFVPAFEPAATAAAITQHAITDVLLVPTMIQMLVDSPAATDADLTSLRRVAYGASPISQALLERAQRRMVNARFTQAYGMTELAPACTLLAPEDHEDPVRSRSAGRPIVTVDVRIVGEGGTPAPRGVVGEVTARGDNVMLGYWNKPEETASALRDGWMHTGDAGYMDENGYLFVVDRIKDMIITGGENVYSVEVENVLAKHPAIAACAVIGLPDEVWGERVHAVVVCAAGESPDAEELRAFCREHIASYKVPRSISFIDALPLSAAGKVLKRDLRSQAWDLAATNTTRGAEPPQDDQRSPE